MKIMLEEIAIKPTRAYPDDAGLDLYTPLTLYIRAWRSKAVDTGVHVEIPHGYVGLLKSKSGLYIKNDVTSEGVIDCGYTGSIVVKLMNLSNEPIYIPRGQKISQLVIVPILLPDLEIVDFLPVTERGDNGFGSTDV